ncbi:MAG: RsmD family RNA methyltransferase [Bacteroidota bacterium]|nr:RsmD family RNA methyltransferase [Bacteroidota bacterium]MDP4204939.1 RsmD family RNA methyltransferase [Bacteroidota bacterium]
MRIVGGTLKGRLFNPGKSFSARPTTDIAKESLFNILINQLDFEEIKVLDLFSGTGSISYEFASRGCEQIIAIEQSYKHQLFIRQTIKDLGIHGIQVIKADVFRYLNNCTDQFDLVFADPPFDLKNLDQIPEILFSKDILKPDGIFILEHPANFNFSSLPYFSRERKYGHVHFSFFSKNIITDNEAQRL